MTEAVLDRTYAPEPEKHTHRPEPSLFRLHPGAAVHERVRKGVADVESLTRLPMQLIEKYAALAVRHAALKQVEDGEWFATIPNFRGVWAKDATEEKTLEALREVVVDWVVLKVQHEDRDLPELEEINLNVL